MEYFRLDITNIQIALELVKKLLDSFSLQNVATKLVIKKR